MTISNERLLQRLQQFEAAGSDARAIGDDEFAGECEDVACVIRELLALREAGKEPVGLRWRHESHHHDNAWSYVTHRTMPDAFESEQVVQYLYAAPQLPAVPDGWVMVPKEPTEDMVINGFESDPDAGPCDDFDAQEAYEAMSGCQQAAHRAKLCWAAMIAAAPKPGA